MNKIKYPNISSIKIQKYNCFRPVHAPLLSLTVLQCFLYAHAFKMASCVTLLLYYKVVFIDFCLEYKHNNGMTSSPDLELKNSFCLAIIFSGND